VASQFTLSINPALFVILYIVSYLNVKCRLQTYKYLLNDLLSENEISIFHVNLMQNWPTMATI
jgi:hypothetical protein